ncbi:MAG: hypothetical protein U5K37_11360 [Natrialbaceae archaeon]|nr:hypothetical protein [Natrialbaceae archaeon]
MTATATSETTGMTLTVERDRSQLDENLRTSALIQGASLIVILLSVVGVGLWEYRVNLTQTTNLLTGFEALRDGRYGHRLSASVTGGVAAYQRGLQRYRGSITGP